MQRSPDIAVNDRFPLRAALRHATPCTPHSTTAGTKQRHRERLGLHTVLATAKAARMKVAISCNRRRKRSFGTPKPLPRAQPHQRPGVSGDGTTRVLM